MGRLRVHRGAQGACAAAKPTTDHNNHHDQPTTAHVKFVARWCKAAPKARLHLLLGRQVGVAEGRKHVGLRAGLVAGYNPVTDGRGIDLQR